MSQCGLLKNILNGKNLKMEILKNKPNPNREKIILSKEEVKESFEKCKNFDNYESKIFKNGMD